MRLFSRLLLLSTDPRSSENQKWLWEFSQTLLPRKRSGDFNQGLMELGALVCTPNAPNCKESPVKSNCPTLTHNMQTKIPAQGKKIDYQTIHEAVVLVARQQKFLVRKCLPNERWAGLWDFPRYCLDSPTDLPQQSCATLQQQICKDYGLEATIVTMNHTLRHAVTRYRIRLTCYQTKRVRGRLRQDRESRWVSPDELRALPMSATGRKVVNQLIR